MVLFISQPDFGCHFIVPLQIAEPKLLLYWKSVLAILANESVASSRLNQKIISLMFFIVAFFIIIDAIISSLVDIYRNFITSAAGMSLFVAVTSVLAAGTYVILKMTGDKIKVQSMKQTHENKIAKGVWAIYYLMIAIMVSVLLQLLFFSEYYTGLLSIAPTISYGLAAFIMGLLAYHFFSWFTRNKSLVVLLYGLATVSSSIYVVLVAVIFYIEIFIHQPAVTTVDSAATFPDIVSGLEEFLIVTLAGILTATTFLSFWGGTIAILYANVKRIGKTRFWILVTTPIIFFLGTLISLFPAMQGDDPNSVIIPLYITFFSQIIAIALFATAFVSMARAIPHHQTSDYMYIACYGLTLFSVSIGATVSGAGYPPFGLPTVSLVGPFSFLLFIGLYRSAISTAEDSTLRKGIKVSGREQLRFLRSIGTAEMERKFEKKVLEVTKLNEDSLIQQSGIEPTLTNEEISNLIMEVKKELRSERTAQSSGDL
jgi:hypothetical protein